MEAAATRKAEDLLGDRSTIGADTGFDRLEVDGDVILRYANAEGGVDEASNPNGSTASIAGITNRARNVAGLMPHPERASEQILGSADGMVLIEGFVASVRTIPV